MAKTIIRDGTSQEERLLPALKEGYINVDEMRFEDLMSFAAGYSRLLKFYGLDNLQDGDWSVFFETDEACVLAALLATSLRQVEADFLRFARQQETMFDNLRSGVAGIEAVPAFELARKVNAWFEKLAALSSTSATHAHEKISEVIAKVLRHELHALSAFLRTISAEATEAGLREFGPAWDCDAAAGNGHVPDAADRHAAAKFLKTNFYAFFNAVMFLQEGAADMLRESLGRADHEPAMGMLIAFLELFARIQRRVNGFTRNHMHFYYGEVLKIPHRGFVPDTAHLIFSPDVAGREVLIGKGTEFSAGVDENNVDLIYAADEELLVNDAVVRALHTVYFERDGLISPENLLRAPAMGNAGSRQFATGAKLNRIADPAAGRVAAGGPPVAQPLFGDPQGGGRKRLFENARLGFAIASSVLLLQQGQRDITLTFRFAEDLSQATVVSFVRQLATALSTTEADAFFKVFRRMFRIWLSAENGWLEIEEYLPLSAVVDASCEADSLKISFRLAESAAAIVPHSAKLHGEGFATGLPVVKIAVNPEAYLYSYSLLRALVLREVVIEAEVKGHTNVLVYNQQGKLNANAQFTPFGPAPVPGDYFVVGCYEAARKKLTAFEVEIDWCNLPSGTKGFGEYYRAYPMPFANAVFKAQLSVLRDRKWVPGADSGQVESCLFDSALDVDSGENGKVAVKRRFVFDRLCELLRPLEQAVAGQYGFDSLAKDGFFRLTLDNPPYGFGHKDYPLVLSQVMLENARRKRFGIFKLLGKSLPPKPLPGQPYTPQANAVSVNYRAVSTISLESARSMEEGLLRERLFHLHPLGIEQLSPQACGKTHLVPQYEADGNLLIGLSASKLAGTLTLFFQLREDSLPEAGTQEFGFNWYYLASNRWHRLGASQVVSDTTNGFLSSGIVTLEIPPDIDRDNTILPGELYWLMLSSNDSRLHMLCSLYAVHAQAVRVSWRKQDGNALTHLAASLPAGTIKVPKRSIAGIAKILQVDDSAGGMPDESDEKWTVRASERLKHKNRAVTPWDYERLVLQRFPQIYKAKCFPCMTGDAEHGGTVAPGHLLVVLIPYLKESAELNMQPMVNALLLREVREFVGGLASPFVKVEVRNPLYEQIQVRCKVRFAKGAARGVSLNRLNREILDYLSPWNAGGYRARFGWSIRCNDIQSLLQGLDYVESVSSLSLLRVSEGGSGKHHLSDTAREESIEIRPAYPWSIATPARHHLIEVVSEAGSWLPVETGIAELSIGGTFILSRGSHD